MIPAQALHRLVRNAVEYVAQKGRLDSDEPYIDHCELLDLAAYFDLDTEDFATLVRVAAGEGSESHGIRFSDNHITPKPQVERSLTALPGSPNFAGYVTS